MKKPKMAPRPPPPALTPDEFIAGGPKGAPRAKKTTTYKRKRDSAELRRLTTYVEADLLRQLKRYALDREVTLAGAINQAVRDMLTKQ